MLAIPDLSSLNQSLRLRSIVMRAFASGPVPLCTHGVFIDPCTAMHAASPLQSACSALLEAACMPVFCVLEPAICPLTFSTQLSRAVQTMLARYASDDKRLLRTLTMSSAGASTDIHMDIMSFTVCTIRFSTAFDNATHAAWTYVPVAALSDEVRRPLIAVRLLMPMHWARIAHAAQFEHATMPSSAHMLFGAMHELSTFNKSQPHTRLLLLLPSLVCQTHVADIHVAPTSLSISERLTCARRVVDVHIEPEVTLSPLLSCITPCVSLVAILPWTGLSFRVASMRGLECAHFVHCDIAHTRDMLLVGTDSLSCEYDVGTVRIMHNAPTPFSDLTAFKRRTRKAARHMSKRMLGAERIDAFSTGFKAARHALNLVAMWTVDLVRYHQELPDLIRVSMDDSHDEFVPAMTSASNPFTRTMLTMLLLTQASDSSWELSMSTADTSAARACLIHGDEFTRLMLKAGMMRDVPKHESLQGFLETILRHVLNDAVERAKEGTSSPHALYAQLALFITHCVHLSMVQTVQKTLAKLRADVFATTEATTIIGMQKDVMRVINVVPEVIEVVKECDRFMQWAAHDSPSDFVVKNTTRMPLLMSKSMPSSTI